MDAQRYDLEEATSIATEAVGHPCPCDGCSADGGRAKSIEIMDLAFDLAGIEARPAE